MHFKDRYFTSSGLSQHLYKGKLLAHKALLDLSGQVAMQGQVWIIRFSINLIG